MNVKAHFTIRSYLPLELGDDPGEQRNMASSVSVARRPTCETYVTFYE